MSAGDEGARARAASEVGFKNEGRISVEFKPMRFMVKAVVPEAVARSILETGMRGEAYMYSSTGVHRHLTCLQIAEHSVTRAESGTKNSNIPETPPQMEQKPGA
jgi:hypothetical protein